MSPIASALALAARLDASAIVEWSDLHDDIATLLGGPGESFAADVQQALDEAEADEIANSRPGETWRPTWHDPGDGMGISAELADRIQVRQERLSLDWLAGVEALQVAAEMVPA